MTDNKKMGPKEAAQRAMRERLAEEKTKSGKIVRLKGKGISGKVLSLKGSKRGS